MQEVFRSCLAVPCSKISCLVQGKTRQEISRHARIIIKNPLTFFFENASVKCMGSKRMVVATPSDRNTCSLRLKVKTKRV